MKCKTCGKNAESEYCFAHKLRKPLPKGRVSVKKENLEEMRDFFLFIWKKRRHFSEISGKYLGNEPMSTYFHHVLPKEKYPQAMYDEENIILLTLEEHDQVEMDIYRYEKINELRNQLKIKYNL